METFNIKIMKKDKTNGNQRQCPQISFVIVCMFLLMWVCVYVCSCVCSCVWVYVRMSVGCWCVCVCLFLHVCVCSCVYPCVREWSCLCVCVRLTPNRGVYLICPRFATSYRSLVVDHVECQKTRDLGNDKTGRGNKTKS